MCRRALSPRSSASNSVKSLKNRALNKFIRGYAIREEDPGVLNTRTKYANSVIARRLGTTYNKLVKSKRK